jgi:hypothetical protein
VICRWLSFFQVKLTCVDLRSPPKTVSPSRRSRRVQKLGLTSETRIDDVQPPRAPVSLSLSSALYLPVGEACSALSVICPRQEVIRQITLQQATRTTTEKSRLLISGTVSSTSGSYIRWRSEPDRGPDLRTAVSRKGCPSPREVPASALSNHGRDRPRSDRKITTIPYRCR